MSSPLYIDRRDGSRNMLTYPVVAEIAQEITLEFGDAMIVGNGPGDVPTLVGVELKSAHDLVSSINTGRIVDQIRGMVGDDYHPAAYDVNWLLWFGSVRPGRGGRLEIRHGEGRKIRWDPLRIGKRDVPYGYLMSFLNDLAYEGVKIAHVYDEPEAAAWLHCLHRWWSKSWDQHKGLRSLGSGPRISLIPGMDDATRLRACVAAQLPGIGVDRAIAVAHHFGSIAAMAAAEPAEWQRVDGIGKVIAGAVVRAIRQS